MAKAVTVARRWERAAAPRAVARVKKREAAKRLGPSKGARQTAEGGGVPGVGGQDAGRVAVATGDGGSQRRR